MLGAQQLEQSVLRRGAVLGLVLEHEAVAALVVAAQVLVGLEERDGPADLIVEVDRPAIGEHVLVVGRHIGQLGVGQAGEGFGDLVLVQPEVLGRRQHLEGGIHRQELGVVEVGVAGRVEALPLGAPDGVLEVAHQAPAQNLHALAVREGLPAFFGAAQESLALNHGQAEGVDGGGLKAVDREAPRAERPRDALAEVHGGRAHVGENQDLLGRRAQFRDQSRGELGKHEGLAGARHGRDGEPAAGVGHHARLGGTQAVT
ncbi:hypothetical protein D3C72_814430 [compost metagenome]